MPGYVYACVCMRTNTYNGEPLDVLEPIMLHVEIHYMGYRDGTQVMRLGLGTFHLPSHLAGQTLNTL